VSQRAAQLAGKVGQSVPSPAESRGSRQPISLSLSLPLFHPRLAGSCEKVQRKEKSPVRENLTRRGRALKIHLAPRAFRPIIRGGNEGERRKAGDAAENHDGIAAGLSAAAMDRYRGGKWHCCLGPATFRRHESVILTSKRQMRYAAATDRYRKAWDMQIAAGTGRAGWPRAICIFAVNASQPDTAKNRRVAGSSGKMLDSRGGESEDSSGGRSS